MKLPVLLLVVLVFSGCQERRFNIRRMPILGSTAKIPIEDLFRDGFIIDGLLNYTVKKDPTCRRDCESKLVPLGEMITLTGAHIGTITVSREVDRCRRVAAYLDRDAGGRVIRTFNDMWAARRENQYGSLLYTQQVPMIRGNPMAVHDWYAAGMRVVQLAYSSRIPLAPMRKKNKLAGGSDEPRQGLTALGRDVVKELVKLNMIIDVSHCSEKTTTEILAMTDVPILANHANAKALTLAVRGPMLLGRNKSDDELIAIAQTGGVIGVTTVAWMLDRDGDTKADIADFLAHVDYIVKLVGIDHVGISSDSRVDGWAVDDIHYADATLADPKRWFIVAQRLRRDFGYSDEMLHKIFGLNFKRVYEQVLPGVHPPELAEGSVDELVFKPAVYRGVPLPTHDVELQVEKSGSFQRSRTWKSSGDTRVDISDLPAATYRWRVVAVSGDIRAASDWRGFEVAK